MNSTHVWNIGVTINPSTDGSAQVHDNGTGYIHYGHLCLSGDPRILIEFLSNALTAVMAAHATFNGENTQRKFEVRPVEVEAVPA